MAIGSGPADGIGCGIGRCDAGRGGRGRATQGWDGLRRDVAWAATGAVSVMC
jgi:hypothetical protein